MQRGTDASDVHTQLPHATNLMTRPFNWTGKKKKKSKAQASDIGDVFAALEEGAAPAEPHGDESQDPLDQPASKMNGVESTEEVAVHVPAAHGHADPAPTSGMLLSLLQTTFKYFVIKLEEARFAQNVFETNDKFWQCSVRQIAAASTNGNTVANCCMRPPLLIARCRLRLLTISWGLGRSWSLDGHFE